MKKEAVDRIIKNGSMKKKILLEVLILGVR